MKQVIFILVLLLFNQSTLVAASEEDEDLQEDAFRGYSTSSMIVETRAKQGETIYNSFTLFNDTDKPVRVSLEVKDFEKKNNQILYKTDTPYQFSINKWSSFVRNEILIDSRGKKEVKFMVTVPPDAEMGEHSALISAMFQPEADEGSTVKMNTQILPVLYVVVTDIYGNVNLDKRWDLTKVTNSSSRNQGILSFNVKNKGNVHVKSEGSLELKSLLGGDVNVVEIPEVNLLANDEKRIEVPWKAPSSFGLYELSYEFSMDGETFKTGKYTVYSVDWIILVSVLLSIILVIAFLIIWWKRTKRKIEKKIVERLKSDSTNRF